MEDAILCSTKNETGKRGKGMKFKKAICAGLSLAMVATSFDVCADEQQDSV